MLIDIQRAPVPDGYGYIAGEPPDGLVLSEGTPASAVIDLFETDTCARVRSTRSAVDGSYCFPALPTTTEFFAVARPPNPAHKYEVQERIFPEAY